MDGKKRKSRIIIKESDIPSRFAQVDFKKFFGYRMDMVHDYDWPPWKYVHTPFHVL